MPAVLVARISSMHDSAFFYIYLCVVSDEYNTNTPSVVVLDVVGHYLIAVWRQYGDHLL